MKKSREVGLDLPRPDDAAVAAAAGDGVGAGSTSQLLAVEKQVHGKEEASLVEDAAAADVPLPWRLSQTQKQTAAQNNYGISTLK